MKIVEDKIYTLEETSKILSISRCTLRRWDNSKYFVAGRTKGKHRIYTGEQINKIKEKMFSKRRKCSC